MSNPADLVPAEPVTLTVGGVELTLSPLTFGQTVQLASQCRPLLVALSIDEADDPPELPEVLIQHAELLPTALATATGQAVDWVRGLTLEEVVLLVEALLAVNADFFARRVLPTLTTALGRTLPRLQTLGAASTGQPSPSA